jgi:tRNA(Ile)-lysidine synthase
MGFVHKVRQTIEQEQLLQAEDTVIVAVSGGPDSVALLHVLKEISVDLRLKLIVVHVNHQFRGIESDQEAASVVKLAEELRLPCEVGTIDVPEYIRSEALNAQVAARDKRYEFLFATAAEYNAQKIALAHHADDQAETILMRLLRGSGTSGLAGMPIRRIEKNVELIRPFLRINKSELLTFCEQRHIIFSEDSSNKDRKYLRNQIRLDIMPYLQQWNSQLPQALNRLGEMLKDEDTYLASETDRVFAQVANKDERGYFFSAEGFASLPVALQRRLIKLILSYLSPKMDIYDYTRVELIRNGIIQQTTPSMELDISEGISFTREYDRISLGRKTRDENLNFTYVVNQFPCEIVIAESDLKIDFQLTDNIHALTDTDVNYYGDKDQAYFDFDCLALPLTIRSRRQGDRIKLVGLNGSKKVKDIFIDEKIAPSRRNQIPVIADAEDRVIWIPGIRFSVQAPIGNQSARILHMKCNHFI